MLTPTPTRPAFAGLLLLSVLLAPPLAAQPGGSATLSGTVSNLATGNLLEGARVELASAGLSALTDNTGRYVLTSVPAGTLEVVVTYTGTTIAPGPDGWVWFTLAFNVLQTVAIS